MHPNAPLLFRSRPRAQTSLPAHRTQRPKRGWSYLAGALCALLSLSGCVEALDASTVGDEFDGGNFEYRCVGGNDAFDPCGQDYAFPETVAVGAEFELRFELPEGLPQGDKPTGFEVISAAPDRLKPLGNHRFKVLASGPLGVLSMGVTPSQEIRAIDFLHLNAKPVERIGIRDATGEEDLSSLRLIPGQIRSLVARPYALGTKLVAAGALPYRWESSDESIVSLQELHNSRSSGLVARRPGTAVITVFQGKTERSIEVTVLSQAPPKKEEAPA